MAQPAEFSVTFWGVRGSIATPGPDTIRYGGNTACCEVRCGEHLLILDAGTGLRALGCALVAAGERAADLLLSHTHLDHVAGMPFFPFAFEPGNALRVFAGTAGLPQTVEQVLRGLMSSPLFPVPLDIFKARLAFHDFAAGDVLTPAPGIVVRTAPLNHPDAATAFRIEFDGRAICYVSDTEHVPGRPDPNVLALIRGAEIVIYDAMFTDDEFPRHVGWGHSTWQEGTRLAASAEIGTLALFHHLPERSDAELDAIGRAAAAAFPGAVVAREGLTLRP